MAAVTVAATDMDTPVTPDMVGAIADTIASLISTPGTVAISGLPVTTALRLITDTPSPARFTGPGVGMIVRPTAALPGAGSRCSSGSNRGPEVSAEELISRQGPEARRVRLRSPPVTLALRASA